MKVFGAINGPLHFIGGDQARTSFELNVREGAPLAWYAEPGVKSKEPSKHRRPHGVVIEGTAPDVHSSGDCCSFMFLESCRKHHPNRRCPSVKSQLCLCHCVAIHSTAHLSFERHLRRLKAPQTVPPARIVIRHGVEQDGCTKTVAETAAPMARRFVGKVSDKGPVRITDGTRRRRSPSGIGERWRRQLLEDMRRGAHEAELVRRDQRSGRSGRTWGAFARVPIFERERGGGPGWFTEVAGCPQSAETEIGKVVASDVDDVLYQDEVGLEEAHGASRLASAAPTGCEVLRWSVVSEGAPRARTRDLLSREVKEFVSTMTMHPRKDNRNRQMFAGDSCTAQTLDLEDEA